MTASSSQQAFLAGLIGSGIQGSRTPSMHEREGAEQGVRYIYKLIDIDKLGVGAEALPELLTAAKRMGFNGLNITYPCKQAIIPLLDELSDDARQLGAVNTVVLQGRPQLRPQHRLVGLCRGLPARPARRQARPGGAVGSRRSRRRRGPCRAEAWRRPAYDLRHGQRAGRRVGCGSVGPFRRGAGGCRNRPWRSRWPRPTG